MPFVINPLNYSSEYGPDLIVSNNNLVFFNLPESALVINKDSSNYSNYIYLKQQNLPASPDQTITEGETLSIPANERLQHPDNEYIWYYSENSSFTNPIQIQQGVGDSFKDLDHTNPLTGYYKLVITNDTFPDLTLTQEPTFVSVEEGCVVRNILEGYVDGTFEIYEETTTAFRGGCNDFFSNTCLLYTSDAADD